jgi:hypothetical protein
MMESFSTIHRKEGLAPVIIERIGMAAQTNRRDG